MSTYDANGGAARAAYALHRAMLDAGIDSRMVVGRKDTDDPTVTAVGSTRFRITSELDRRISRLERSPVRTWRSAARLATLTADTINRTSFDVVNLHWVTDGLLSVEEIGRITKPVVWSMYDMWPFTGTEHYCADIPDARWREGYTPANRPNNEGGLDIDRWTFKRKANNWNHLSHHAALVPASSWLEEATRASSLLGDWRVERIPHVVSDTEFRPREQSAARRSFGVPADRPTILFLASAGIDDRRKGFDLLEAALPGVIKHHPDAQLLIAGPVSRDYECPVPIDIRWLGALSGNVSLATAYNAADIVVAPSREDNMPLTAMEAHTCGRPVVAFGIGGLPDIVTHMETGYLARPFDTSDLAIGLREGLDQARRWGEAARARAEEDWLPDIVVPRYLSLYEAAQQ